MTAPDTLICAVADAIATADVDGATYEDLALAALKADRLFREQFMQKIVTTGFSGPNNTDQEDDGA